MRERIEAEFGLLRSQFVDLKYDEPLTWFVIPEFPLPLGVYNLTATPLSALLPPTYPAMGPDNFFVSGDLRLTGGAMPPNFNLGARSNSGPAPLPGNWGWFSWHPANWNAGGTIGEGDNLLTFIRGVAMCLLGREST